MSAAIQGEFVRSLCTVEPQAFLRRVPGRETFVWRDADVDAPIVVKRTRESSLARALWNDRSAGCREYDNLCALAAEGIPVPRAIGWYDEPRALGRASPRSIVAMEFVEHTETLRERLARCDVAEQRAWCARLAELVVRLHSAGWCHRDLYLQHLVVRGEGLVLLDVGRAQRARARRWFVKDLAALLHSTPRAVGTRARLAFLAAYLDGRGIVARPARRRFAADVAAKEARIAAHRPRHGEDRPWQDL